MRGFLILSTAVLLAIAVGLRLAPEAKLPVGVSVRAPSSVGALFALGSDGQLGDHFCSASIISSPTKNVVLTAAHCLRGHSLDEVAFVPGYYDGRTPFGVWRVDRKFVDEAWTMSGDPDDDFAFLVVSDGSSGARLSDVAIGERLGIDEPSVQQIRAIGYPDGANSPVSCENEGVAFSATQIEFNCGGFATGTSGGPLLVDEDHSTGTWTVIGVIGGYQMGGDLSDISYAARFTANLLSLYKAVASS